MVPNMKKGRGRFKHVADRCLQSFLTERRRDIEGHSCATAGLRYKSEELGKVHVNCRRELLEHIRTVDVRYGSQKPVERDVKHFTEWADGLELRKGAQSLDEARYQLLDLLAVGAIHLPPRDHRSPWLARFAPCRRGSRRGLPASCGGRRGTSPRQNSLRCRQE